MESAETLRVERFQCSPPLGAFGVRSMRRLPAIHDLGVGKHLSGNCRSQLVRHVWRTCPPERCTPDGVAAMSPVAEALVNRRI